MAGSRTSHYAPSGYFELNYLLSKHLAFFNMTRPKYKPRAGKGAKAHVLTKMIYPRRPVPDPKQKCIVVLESEEEILINGKLQQCYTFKIDGTGEICHAIGRYVYVYEEGDADNLFDPSLPGPDDPAFQKSKKPVKWRKSEAKKILYNLLMTGAIPIEEDKSMPARDVYIMDPAFAEYDFDKFKSGLNRIRKKIIELDNRADEDLKAFRNYKQHHKPSIFSHKGYIQWQGSTAQELLWDDLDAYLKDPTKKPKDLWLSRDEYKYSFPLEAFRDKIKQEICTEKYLATRRARADGLNV